MVRIQTLPQESSSTAHSNSRLTSEVHNPRVTYEHPRDRDETNANHMPSLTPCIESAHRVEPRGDPKNANHFPFLLHPLPLCSSGFVTFARVRNYAPTPVKNANDPGVILAPCQGKRVWT